MAKVAPADARGKSCFVDSPSGRRIEYRISGRCGPDDPVLLVIPGMVPAGFGPAVTALRLTRASVKGEVKKTEQVIDEQPWKIVTLARPGYDGSSLNKSYKLMTYDDQCIDIFAVMDHVGAAKFAISASSSGGPYALSVAYKQPERVSAIQLDCCDANYGPGYPKGKKMNEPIADGADVTYLDGNARPGGLTWWCCCMNPCCCCCQCCYKGFFMDLYIETGPVPYKLEDINCPVQIISGAKDDSVDPNCSKFHASKLPNAKMEVIEGMGHCQIPGEVWEQKLNELRALAMGESKEAAPQQAQMS